jgi:hypothetical protein
MSDQQPKKKPVRPGNWSNQFARFSHLVVINSPGMRVIKTMLAILLCLLIDYLRRNPTPVNATIAAVVCLQNDLRSTFLISLNRALGTLLAGLYSYIFILVFIRYFGMNPDSFLYYLLVGVCSLPLMHLMVRTHMPGAVAISAIVYVLICVSGNTASPLEYTVMRMIDTFVGIAVALFVNWLPPLNELGKRLKKVQLHVADRALELERDMHDSLPEEGGRRRASGSAVLLFLFPSKREDPVERMLRELTELRLADERAAAEEQKTEKQTEQTD